jgi:nitroreductase / dihydropteridine reductase
MQTFLSQLDWRFATKQFDPSRKVASEDIEKIMDAIRKAPSSFGIQPYHVYVIADHELKERMRSVSYDQPQVADASHLFVFCARTDIIERINAYGDIASGGDEAAKEAIHGLIAMMHGSLDGRTPEEKLAWASKQAYIALGFALAACAELGIDSCPMEGFDSGAVNLLLGVPDHMKSLAYMAVGYRAAEDLFMVR